MGTVVSFGPADVVTAVTSVCAGAAVDAAVDVAATDSIRASAIVCVLELLLLLDLLRCWNCCC